jgi:predicted nuclease of predicted toxin-antitoxin system
MKVLLDQGTPVPLRRHLHPHEVDTTAEQGWSELKNGELLNEAEANGYQVLITTDQNLKHQQNLANRSICVVVLTTTSWPRIEQKAERVRECLAVISEGDYVEIEI